MSANETFIELKSKSKWLMLRDNLPFLRETNHAGHLDRIPILTNVLFFTGLGGSSQTQVVQYRS